VALGTVPSKSRSCRPALTLFRARICDPQVHREGKSQIVNAYHISTYVDRRQYITAAFPEYRTRARVTSQRVGIFDANEVDMNDSAYSRDNLSGTHT